MNRQSLNPKRTDAPGLLVRRILAVAEQLEHVAASATEGIVPDTCGTTLLDPAANTSSSSRSTIMTRDRDAQRRNLS